MAIVNEFFQEETIHKLFFAVILLVIGVLAIRIVMRTLKKQVYPLASSSSTIQRAAVMLEL